MVIEYGVNDGWPDAGSIEKMGFNGSWSGATQRLEAVSEFLVRFLLDLPSQPAVIWLETGAGNALFNPTVAHLEAAERFGVPFAR